MKRAVVILLLAAPLLLAACGGGDDKAKASDKTDQTDQTDNSVSSKAKSDDSDSTDQTDQTDGSDAGNSKADTAAAKKALTAWEAAVVKEGFTKEAGADDFTDGTGGDASDSSDDLQFTSKECKAFSKLLDQKDASAESTADVESASFTKGAFNAPGDSEESVMASVTFAKSETELKQEIDLLSGDKLQTCLKEAFNASFATDAPAGGTVTVDVAAADPGKIGDQHAGFVATIDLKTDEVEVPIQVSGSFVRKGHVGALVFHSVTGGGAPTADVAGELKLLLDQATK